MAIRTQGTDLYVIDPDDNSVLNVGCITSIDGIDSTLDQIETTCLNSDARTYLAGLATPGTATFEINTDPSDDAHVRLHQMKVAGENLQWAVGWSDGTVDPTTDSNDEFDPPTTRSWLLFEGFMNSFSFSFAQNDVVTSSIGIQVSGEPVLMAKQ